MNQARLIYADRSKDRPSCPGGREDREVSGTQLMVIVLIWMLVTQECLIYRNSLVCGLSLFM